jgi:hypothetical protein
VSGAIGSERFDEALDDIAGSIHPQSPNLMSQQQATTPARPTPPRQCMRTCTPRRVKVLIKSVRCVSRDAGASGARPSGVGKLDV